MPSVAVLVMRAAAEEVAGINAARKGRTGVHLGPGRRVYRCADRIWFKGTEELTGF